MLAKITRNKIDNGDKSYNKNLDFMLLIQNNINGHVEWEWQNMQFCYALENSGI